jgi:dihydroorotase
MPNTSPVADNAGTIELINNAARKRRRHHVYPTGCITVGMKGQQLAPHGSLKKAGVVAITDDGLCVESNQLMRNASNTRRCSTCPCSITVRTSR